MPAPDEAMMRRALALAERARGRTAPNPMVGAVVVRDGRIVGEGYHRRAGEPHAEVLALAQAGDLARGATLYVTLEPCDHHGRTPPCTEAILRAGIARVVVAMADPNPQVQGRGLARLRAAGVAVECGLLEAAARRSNEAFVKRHTTGLPFVTLKLAMSLDGRVATRTGDSRWITGAATRAWVHRLRDTHDAVMVGIGTVRTDDPLLTARLPGARNPVRVVVDARGETPLTARLVTTGDLAPTWIALGGDVPAERQRALAAAGATLLHVPTVAGRLDLVALMAALAQRDILSVLVEGGPTLAGSLLEQGLVDRLIFCIAPKLIGGAGAPGPLGGLGIERMAEARHLAHVTLRRIGEDWIVIADVHGHR